MKHVSNQQIIQKLTSLESDSDDSDDDSDDVSFFFRFFNAFELFTDSASSFFENFRKQKMSKVNFFTTSSFNALLYLQQMALLGFSYHLMPRPGFELR